MRVVDTAIVGAVNEQTHLAGGGLVGGNILGFPVYVAMTGVDVMTGGQVVLSYPVPFATYTSSVGDDDNYRLSGRKTRRSVFFTFTYAGTTLQQAKWAGEKLRLKLQRTRPVIVGRRLWPIDLQQSQRIRRDDNVMRPDGSPLYYGIDDYAVSIVLTETGVTIP